MSSTNKTTNYELSQYVGADKPTYLGDYNSDMLKIDTQMKNNADNISSVSSTATTASTNASTAITNAATAQTAADNAATAASNANTTATSALTKATANETAIVALNAANDYSDTTEKVVGTWIDGRPVYRKVFEYSTKETQYEAAIDYPAMLVNISGYIYRTDYAGLITPIPRKNRRK